MPRYLTGQQVTKDFFTYNASGDLTDCDTDPTIEVTREGQSVDSSFTNPSTGRYTVTFTPASRGRHVVELTGEIDSAAEYGVQRVTVHDGLVEAQGYAFADGISSWESAVS